MNPELENLVAAGRLAAPVAAKVSDLEPGTFVTHKSWGAGRVREWDLIGDRMVIDFEDREGHGMKLEFAARSLDPIPGDHILARRFEDPEQLRKLAEDDPAEIVRLALESFGGTLMLDDLEGLLKGKIVPEGRYKGWWDAAKKKLRAGRRFVVPAKRTEPLQLREADVEASEEMVREFLEARDLKSKVKALEAILADLAAFELPEDQLKPVVDHIEEHAPKALKINPGAVVEMVLARDLIHGHAPGLRGEVEDRLTIESILIERRGDLDSLISSLSSARQRKLYEAMPDAFGDVWVEEALSQMNSTGARGIAEIAKFLVAAGKQPELETFLRTGIQHRTLNADVLVWVCRERNGLAKNIFDSEMAPCLINVLERDYYDETNRSSRLHDLLLNDSRLVSDLMGKCDGHQAKNFARRLMATPVYEELNKRSLLARIVKARPEVKDIVSGEDREGEDSQKLVVSWESLEKRKRAYERLVQVEIPENTREIQVARSYGDLRENFEYKAAKEMQAVLRRRQTEMERDITRARGTDFRDVDTGGVAIGTRVTFEDTSSGEVASFTILGAWDTNLAQGIISYLSETAVALLGKKVGETASLPTETENVTRSVRITKIERYLDIAPVSETAAEEEEDDAAEDGS